MTRNRAAYLAAAMTVLATSAAWSGTSEVQRTVVAGSLDGVHGAVRVRYDDLDLSRDEGIEALYARLDTAARRACGHYDIRNMRERRSWRACHQAALSQAVERIGIERLAALAESPRERRRAMDARITAETRALAR